MYVRTAVRALKAENRRRVASCQSMKKIFGLICIIGSIALGVAMFKQQAGDSSDNKGNKVTRHSAPVVLLVLGMRLLFAGGSGGSISLSLPKRSSQRDISAGLPGNPALRGGQDTFATNPAQLDLNFIHWLAANPRHIVFYAATGLTGLVLFVVKWQVGVALLIAGGIAFWRTRQDMRRKFVIGDVCPGVVLSAEKGLVAVLTDLKAATNVARPAIKILKQPLRKIKIYALQDGMRVASVAEYYGNVHETTWKNFFPEVIPCSVHDEVENQRILASIPEAQWQALDQHLAQIPEPNPGLYRLWGGNLAADVGAAVPWLQRKAVRIGLIVFACLGLAIVFMQASVRRAEQARDQRELTASSSVAPSPNPISHPAPNGRQPELDLRGKTVSVTNFFGRVYENIQLLGANPSVLYYQVDGDGMRRSESLASLPVGFLDSLNIPKDWAGYQAAVQRASWDNNSPPPPRSSAPAAAKANGYTVGQRIYAQWAGKWIPGTVVANFSPFSCRVQLEDPRWRNPIVLSTNLLRPQ